MTLIEQAVRRLDELRRAGADLGPHDAGTVVAPWNAERPGAATRRESPHRAGDHGADLHAPDGRSEATPRTTRRVDVDVGSLRAMGFVVPTEPRSQLADEFRVVKRPILANAATRGAPRGRDRNLVMVTSAVAGEGKTFTAINLAMSIAMEIDHRVLLVDADVTRPSMPRIFGVPAEPGLLDLLTRPSIGVQDALVATGIERLSLLPAGTPDGRATELLASAQMASLLEELASRYADRIVVFDAPPLLGTTESRVLASRVGQVLLVVAADQTPKPIVAQALETIEGCDIVLTLLNKACDSEVSDYYQAYAGGNAD